MSFNEPEELPGLHPYAKKETPLINRVEEMGFLKEAANKAIGKQGGVVILYGEAGIGKTRLTRELRTYVRSGMQILSGKGSSLLDKESVPPYVLWKEVIRNYLHDCTPEQLENAVGFYPGEICKIVPEIKQKLANFPESPPLGPEQERDRLFEAVSQFVVNISKTTPLMLVLDDLQWCDQSSLLLLHYIARGVYRDPLLLLGAYRDTEIDEKHQLFPVLTDLKRERLLNSVRLKRFSLDEVTEIIKKILWQDNVPKDFCNLIYEKTQGNPFFVEEVIESLLEEGIIYPHGVEYHFKEISEIEFPETVKSVLQARLGRLDDETLQVLTMASFVGNDFSLKALRNVAGIEQNRLLQIIEKMMTKRLLNCRVVRGEETCSFSDVLIKDALYESVGPLRRKKLHRIVGRALEKEYAKDIDEHLGELAAHFLEGGEKEKAFEYFLKAGEKAARIYANNEAKSYFESALRLFDEIGGELQEKARILEAIGDVKSLIGEYDACLKCWNEASLVWQQLEEKEKVARLHRKSSNVLLHKMGNTESAKEHQLKALEILEAQPESVELVKLRADMAHMYWHVGDAANALALAEKAIETAEKLESQEAIANSLLVWGKIAGYMGEKEKTSVFYEKALKIALENGYAETAVEVYMYFSRVQEKEKGLEYLQKGYELAKKVGSVSAQSWIGNRLATTYLDMGNTDKALIQSKESVDLDRKTRNLHNLCLSLIGLGKTYLTLGEFEKTEKLYNEALNIAEKQNIFPAIATAYFHLGIFHIAKEEYTKAIEFAMMTQSLVRKAGLKTLQAFPFGAWAYIELGELEKAESQINIAYAIAQKLNYPQAIAFVDVVRANLLRAQKKWNESIAQYEKSLQEAEALDFRNWQVRFYARNFLCEYARVFLERDQKGDREKARTLLNQALELFQKMHAKKEIETVEKILANIEKNRPITWETKPTSLVSTGYAALDKLLYGGINPNLTVALTSPPGEDQDNLIKSFLETGASKGETTFYLAIDPRVAGFLAEQYPSNFYLFVCNPQAESIVKAAPNVFTLKGVENLTGINIALMQAIRKLDPSPKNQRRICIDIVSDVLLQHRSVQTRKWLTDLLMQLRSAGFTTLAVINPQMHIPEELYAILSLFEGEVNIREVETDKGITRFLKIKRLSNQKYVKEEKALLE
jgi:predicted ATPase/KaiC/GvpD/RAD55 family RecA-like ATPase